jgi:hypothetical protein
MFPESHDDTLHETSKDLSGSAVSGCCGCCCRPSGLLITGDPHPIAPPAANRREEDAKQVGSEVQAFHHLPIGAGQPVGFRHIYSAKLRETCDPRSGCKHALCASGFYDIQLARQTWARPYEAHLAKLDVPKLRQFVELRPAQKPAETSDVGGLGEMGGKIPRTDPHRPELEKRELRPACSYSALTEQGLPGVEKTDEREQKK